MPILCLKMAFFVSKKTAWRCPDQKISKKGYFLGCFWHFSLMQQALAAIKIIAFVRAV
jgi:hypothetical protein